MIRLLLFLLLFNFLSFQSLFAQKPRLIVTTDIGQDPDDQQSMVRLLHYANEFQMEGLIANADVNYDKEPPILKDDIIHKMIDAYAKIESNFKKYDQGFPTADYLHSIVKKGCIENGTRVPVEEYIGKGKDTEGADWIIQVIDQENPEPVNIAIWGGACDLAQALWKVKNTRTEEEVAQFVAKLRVFFIGKQDSSNEWIMENFPKMWLILALDRGGDKWESGYRGMFWGGDMSTTSKEWLQENIISQNPVAAFYPDKAFTGGKGKNPYGAMKEGDSPSLLYFLPNGLNSIENPQWGSWGGRYSFERDAFYRDANDTFFDEQTGKEISSPRATVFRWRPDFQRDFANRVQWGKSENAEGNQYPVISLKGHKAKDILEISAKPGKELVLDAGKSKDPDGDKLSFEWMVYPEAGNLKETPELKPEKDILKLKVPKLAAGEELHIILKVKDDAKFPVCAYKRIVIRND